MPEAPYGIIWRYLRAGQVIPFLGAGCSFSGRPPDAEWDRGSTAFLPSGKELARWLADESQFPDQTDRENLAKVSSYYQESDSREGLVTLLGEVFEHDYPVGPIHEFLAELDVPLLIVTTNYDNLIEKAFQNKKKPYHLVVHPTEDPALAASVLWFKPGAAGPEAFAPNKLTLSPTDTTIIYKMHGGIDEARKPWNGCVITEEDYVDFLSRMTGQSAIPARFMMHFRECRFLFLGYGLTDWNLRVMLKNIQNVMASPKPAEEQSPASPIREEDRKAWAIQYRPLDLEKVLWQKRNVNIYDMKVDDFVKGLSQRRERELHGTASAGS
jgi:hypothetical protein